MDNKNNTVILLISPKRYIQCAAFSCMITYSNSLLLPQPPLPFFAPYRHHNFSRVMDKKNVEAMVDAKNIAVVAESYAKQVGLCSLRAPM